MSIGSCPRAARDPRRRYAMGTAFRMGPGYFPVLLGGLLALLGAAISLRALWIDEGNRMGGLAWRPVLLVLGRGLVLRPAAAELALLLAWPLEGWQRLLARSFVYGTSRSPLSGKLDATPARFSLTESANLRLGLSLPAGAAGMTMAAGRAPCCNSNGGSTTSILKPRRW
ncbi:hypothetical protein [Azospirillum agricola]|uniref:hypothetical protein n=1 Tax=Azospirillum agricola TaxID=1720247 RepID=UPI000A0F1102|nr:hypothetical protein [Azospirillum agricola]SMH40387.1 hypothetical protein SAMN02982994_1627 [Azospirillum lipoferum]